MRSVGFPWVMRAAGLANVAYCSLLVYLALERRRSSSLAVTTQQKEYSSFDKAPQPPQRQAKYERFYDSDDGL